MSERLRKSTQARVEHFARPHPSLGGHAVSPGAKALVSHCIKGLVVPSLRAQQKRPFSLPAIERATEGLLAGLIAAQLRTGDGWTSRPMSAASFASELGVRPDQFRRVCSALCAAGLIETAPDLPDQSEPLSRVSDTRLRLSEAGKDLAAAYGLTRGSEVHFLLSQT